MRTGSSSSSSQSAQHRLLAMPRILHCCSFLLVLVLVAADFEYYPDPEGGGSSEADTEARARLERLVRLLQRRSHRYEQQEQGEEAARQEWSQRLLRETLAMQRERQREQQQLLRDQGELLEQPELLGRPEVLGLLQEAARLRELRQRQRLLQREQQQARQQQQQQQQQRLQELDYPELRAGVEHERARPEFSYSFEQPARSSQAQRPFAVAPNDPRFYGERAWSRARQEGQERERQGGEEAEATTRRAAAEQQPAKVEQRRASASASGGGGGGEELRVTSLRQRPGNEDAYVIALVAGCSAALMFALVLMSLLWCRLQRVSKAAKDVDYPAYGVTGPNKDLSPSSAADQRLAQSAQMYHFQHQKQQIIAMEKASTGAAAREPGSVSEAESDEENDEGDYTVYECPGLAPTGEMEVKNPLFHDEPTPHTPANSKHDL